MKPTKRSHGYEFGGPVGVFFLMIALPAMVLGSALFCNSKSCSVREKPVIPPFWGFKGAFFDVGHLIVDGWIIFQAIIYMLPFGKVVQGRVLENGSALDYRINGFLALTLFVTGFAACLYFKVDVTLVYDCFIGITTATLCWSVVIAILVYAMACMQKTGLSPRGNTGNIIYDFFMGHQLNPRWGKFDFKLFFEIRAGLIGWNYSISVFVATSVLHSIITTLFPPLIWTFELDDIWTRCPAKPPGRLFDIEMRRKHLYINKEKSNAPEPNTKTPKTSIWKNTGNVYP